MNKPIIKETRYSPNEDFLASEENLNASNKYFSHLDNIVSAFKNAKNIEIEIRD